MIIAIFDIADKNKKIENIILKFLLSQGGEETNIAMRFDWNSARCEL